jgi:hypothetical protein
VVSESDDDRGDRKRRVRRRTEAASPPTLHCEIVEHPSGTDRCTLYPPGTSGVSRMSTWLSVDADCLLELEERR